MPPKIKKQQSVVSKTKGSQMKKNKSSGGINKKFQDHRNNAQKTSNDRSIDCEQPTQNNNNNRPKKAQNTIQPMNPAPAIIPPPPPPPTPAPPPPPARIESQYKPPQLPPLATSPKKPAPVVAPPPPPPPIVPPKEGSYYTQLTAPPCPIQDLPPPPPIVPPPPPPHPPPPPQPPQVAQPPPVIITVPDPPRLPPPPIPVPLPPQPQPPVVPPVQPVPPPQPIPQQQQPVPVSPIPLYTPPQPAVLIPNPHAGGAACAPQPANLPPTKQHSQPGVMANVFLPGMRAVVQAFQPIINHDKPPEKVAEKGAEKPRKAERFDLQEEPSSTNEEADRGQQVSNWVKRTLEIGIAALKKEYYETPNEAPIEKAQTFKDNPTKNRYWNIACNDATRFRIAELPNYYIHANFVGSGQANPRRFLCAQAPLVSTVEDFWRMVIISGTEYIVMLCDLVEKGKQKSAEYFPQKIGETMNIGMYCSVVKEHFQEVDKTVTMSKFRVTLTETGAVSTLKHLHWHNWPDHGAPDTFVSPFRVVMHVRRSRRPILVHCSAGVGRTGTLVLIATILENIKSADFPGVSKVLSKMREERFKCVQTEIQYLYVHRCLVEYLVLKNLCANYSKDLLKKFREDYDQTAEKNEKA